MSEKSQNQRGANRTRKVREKPQGPEEKAESQREARENSESQSGARVELESS